MSLIAGVKYRVQRWGGEWDGMMGVANSCNWHFVQGLFIHLLFFYGNRFMQQQRSQEDSYIHKRLIANINLGPCTKTKNTTQ